MLIILSGKYLFASLAATTTADEFGRDLDVRVIQIIKWLGESKIGSIARVGLWLDPPPPSYQHRSAVSGRRQRLLGANLIVVNCLIAVKACVHRRDRHVSHVR
jgi:hypothetical protein